MHKITKFLEEYLNTLNEKDRAIYEKLPYEVWGFGQDKEFSERLIGLVVSGKKTATAGLYLETEIQPIAGSLAIIVDHNFEPTCLIEYTKIEVKPFLEVDLEFSKEEGEGFVDLEDWRENHRKIFKLWHPDVFSENSLVVCERFKLLYPR